MKEALNVLKFTFQKSSMTVKEGHLVWKPVVVLLTDVKLNKDNRLIITKIYIYESLITSTFFFSSVLKKQTNKKNQTAFQTPECSPKEDKCF